MQTAVIIADDDRRMAVGTVRLHSRIRRENDWDEKRKVCRPERFAQPLGCARSLLRNSQGLDQR
jgi:hypothetical protein